MKIGLHCLFSPVYQYPDGSVHPSTYDWKLFNFELARPPALNATNMDTWVAGIKAIAGRAPIRMVDPAVAVTNFDADYYEIGNEMNYNAAVSPETYAVRLATQYAAIKAAKPSATVILGGTDSWQHGGNASKWLTKMMAELEKLGFGPNPPKSYPFDVVGVHLYPHGPLSEIDRIPEMFKSIEAWRWAWRVETKPVWCTEFGILKDACRFRDMPKVVQADCITRMMRHAKNGGCAAAIWYAADQHDMGLGTGVAELQDSVAMWNAISV